MWKASARDDEFEFTFSFFFLTQQIDSLRHFTCKYVSEIICIELIWFFFLRLSVRSTRHYVITCHSYYWCCHSIYFILSLFLLYFFLLSIVCVWVLVCSLSICVDRSYRRRSLNSLIVHWIIEHEAHFNTSKQCQRYSLPLGRMFKQNARVNCAKICYPWKRKFIDFLFCFKQICLQFTDISE